MTTLGPIYHQYRTFNHVYSFKVKNDETLVLKIFDCSQKCLYKKSLSTQELAVPNMERLFDKSDIPIFLQTLVRSKHLPENHLPESSSQKDPSDLSQALAQVIEQFKPKVFAEPREIEGLSCPLTLELFREPVIDNHGHTFEKKAIEEHLKTKNDCPLNRQPIASLTPNRLVRQTIEPTFRGLKDVF